MKQKGTDKAVSLRLAYNVIIIKDTYATHKICVYDSKSVWSQKRFTFNS